MADAALELEIRAELGALKGQLGEATILMRQLADATGGGGGTGDAFARAEKNTRTFYDVLREKKGEAVQHQRVFGYFGKQIEALGVTSRETGAAMVGAFTALASGSWVLAVIEGVKLVISIFADAKEKAKKAQEEIEKAVTEPAKNAVSAWESYKRSMMGGVGDAEGAVIALARPYKAQIFELGLQIDAIKEKWAKGANAAKSLEEIGKLEEKQKQLREVVQWIETEQRVEAERLEQVRVQRDTEKAYLEETTRLEAEKVRKKEEAVRREKELMKEQALFRARFFTESDLPEEMLKKPIDMGAVDKNAKEAGDRWRAAWRKEMEEQVELAELTGDPFKAAELRKQMATIAGEPPALVNAKYIRDLGKAWNEIGSAMGNAFTTLGTAIGGQAGKMISWFGQMIQQAIQLAVALAATAGPFGWINAAVAAASLIATVMSIPKFERGTPYVPFTGPAIVHEGEAILPAGGPAEAWRSGQGGAPITIYALDGASIKRTLRSNRGELARALRDLQRDRRA